MAKSPAAEPRSRATCSRATGSRAPHPSHLQLSSRNRATCSPAPQTQYVNNQSLLESLLESTGALFRRELTIYTLQETVHSRVIF